MDGILSEMNRVREVMKQYEEIGPVGQFGLIMLKQEIKTAEQAIASGDVVKMLQSYESLKDCN